MAKVHVETQTFILHAIIVYVCDNANVRLAFSAY